MSERLGNDATPKHPPNDGPAPGMPSQSVGLDRRESGRSLRDGYVSIENVCKSYGSFNALSDVSLTCAEGEFLTLLGPSGSGKSTLLRILAGLERPDSGRVLLNGEDVVPVAPHRRNIGVMFQSYAVFPHMTVYENVRFPLRMRKVRDCREIVMDTLRLVGLESRAEAKPSQLSGGQQQRVALARALVFGPRLLLLDEPLSALDRQLREMLQYELRELQLRLSVTTISVTHDQDEALRMSDRIAVVKDGRIRQIGAPAELYRHPADAFVAAFLGTTNLLHGDYTDREGGPGIKLADGTLIRGTGAPGAVTAAVKAEEIRLFSPGESLPPGCNVVGGAVTLAAFEGARTMVKVALEEPGGTFTVASGGERYRQGDRVLLAWNPEVTSLVPANAPSAEQPTQDRITEGQGTYGN